MSSPPFAVIGPSWLDLIGNLVQVQSIANLGVLFMLFSLGMKFSVHRLRQVWRVSLFGGMLMWCITVGAGWLCGYYYDSRIEGMVVGICLSLASAAVVLRCINPQVNSPPYMSICYIFPGSSVRKMTGPFLPLPQHLQLPTLSSVGFIKMPVRLVKI